MDFEGVSSAAHPRFPPGPKPRRWIQLASVFLLSCTGSCCAQEDHVGNIYLVEPPNWERTDNWRPLASPGNTFYWHDRESWAPECPWDIGRLTNTALAAPACTWTFGCSVPGCSNQCVANMFQRIEDAFQPQSAYQLSTLPDGPPLPLYEAPPRFPIGRSAFAVDAYRCPLIAATILNLATANNISLASSQGLAAPGVACPSSDDIDRIAPILNAYSTSIQPIPEPFKSPVDNAIWPFTYKPSYATALKDTPVFGALAFAGTADEAKDIIGRYCTTEVVGQELQEVIYNVLPEYQEGLLYDPLAGPDGQDRSLCRDKEGILDDIPRSSELKVVQVLYNKNLQAIEGSQCYGHLSQYLDPNELPWQDRLSYTSDTLPVWKPAANAWRALHDTCRAITVEDSCKDSLMPVLQRAVVTSMLAYQTSVGNASTWNDPYQTTFSRPAPPLPPPPPPSPDSEAVGVADAPTDGTYNDLFLSGDLQIDGTPEQQGLIQSSDQSTLQHLHTNVLIAVFTAILVLL